MTCHSSGRSPIIAIGFGPLVDPVAHAHAEAAAEQHDLHLATPLVQITSSAGIGNDQPAAPLPDVAELLR